jgi:hypothetical protein
MEKEAEFAQARSQRKNVYTGSIVLFGVLIAIFILFHCVGGTDKHFDSFGPSDDLKVLDVKIDTVPRFVAIITIIGIIYAARAYIKNAIWPHIKYPVFNPNQTVIYGFSFNEYTAFTGYIKFVDELIELLLLSIILTQLDFLIFGNIINSIVMMVAARRALKTKTIIP